MNNILIVDDVADNLRILASVLNSRGYKTRCANSGAMALKAANLVIPDLILLDIKMPDLDGYQVCQQLKSNSLTKDIPVIFLSALDDVLDKIRAFEVGGADYLTKPFTVEEVLIRVENHLALRSAKLQIEQFERALEQKVTERTLKLEIANQNLVATNQQLELKILERQQLQQQLIQNALYDSLTRLPNRTLLLERIDLAIEQGKRNPDYLFAVLFIDLDRFKIINDSLGHSIGDKLLVEVAKLLSEDIRSVDTVARLGGDEFVILLGDIKSVRDATQVGDRLQARFKKVFNLSDRAVFTTVSIGIALGSSNYRSSSEILRDADTAMYRAKEKGKARYEVFDRKMYLKTLKAVELEHQLGLALQNEEFTLYYQPIVALDNNTLVGFEALILWQHPLRGLISPMDFVPVAEDTGLILSIGNWVLRQTCRQLVEWQKQYAAVPGIANLIISINVASRQIQDPSYIHNLDRVLNETGINPSCLRLEITEKILVDSDRNIQETLLQIKRRKIRLSIDDFGTGYSSVSDLRRLPIDNFKIDRSLINRIDRDRESREIVQTIITLAHALRIKAIAEGVETVEQLEQLQTLGCELAQGYLFGKPLNVETAKLMLEKNFSTESQTYLPSSSTRLKN